MYKNVTPIFIIILLGFIAFGMTLKLGFVWYDHEMIEGNPYITQWTIKNICSNLFLNLFNQDLYRPVGIFLHMIEFSIWKINSFGYHLTSLFLHITNAVLIYLFLIRLFFNKEVAFLSSILFVIHPIIVEQLILIGSRAELLVNFFMFISLLLFLQERFIFRLFSIAAFVLTMLSKESGIIFPIVLLLILWFKNSKVKEFIWLIPFIILTIPYLILRNSIIDNSSPKIEIVKILQFLFLQFPEILFVYLRLLLLPLGLHSRRQIPVYGQEIWIFLLLFLLFVAILLIKRSKVGIFCLLWFILLLLPKIPGLMTWRFMADHWIYTSSLGIFLPLTLLYQKFKQIYPKVAQLLLLIILVTYISIANFNIVIRGNDFLMYQHALKYSSATPLIYNMGWIYYQAGNFDKALEYFQKALKRHPQEPDYQNVVALTTWQLGNTDKAIKLLKEIHKTYPNYISSYLNLGLIYLRNGNYREARKETEMALKLNQNSQEGWYQLGEICHQTNDIKNAKRYYQQVLKINPYYHLARNNLAIIYAEEGNYQKAKKHFEFILHYHPNNEFAKKNIAKLNKFYIGK